MLCGARYSYVVEHLLMVQWVIDIIAPFSFQPVIHNWCNRGMYCPFCVVVHIKDILLLIRMSSICGSSKFLHAGLD